MALQAVEIALAPSIVGPNIAILHPSQLLQTFLEGCRPSPDLGIALVQRHQHADPPQSFRLLRARRERPCDRRAAEQGDEVAALHVAPLSWQLAQQLLRNAYDVVFAVV